MALALLFTTLAPGPSSFPSADLVPVGNVVRMKIGITHIDYNLSVCLTLH